RPDVQDGAVALLDIAFAGDLGSREVAAADNFGVRDFCFFQSRKVFFGDDEDVSRRLRGYVFESEDMVVFVDLCCRDLAANDTAEKAGGSWIGNKKNPAREATITLQAGGCQHSESNGSDQSCAQQSAEDVGRWIFFLANSKRFYAILPSKDFQ